LQGRAEIIEMNVVWSVLHKSRYALDIFETSGSGLLYFMSLVADVIAAVRAHKNDLVNVDGLEHAGISLDIDLQTDHHPLQLQP
jgi:hypothetical protein